MTHTLTRQVRTIKCEGPKGPLVYTVLENPSRQVMQEDGTIRVHPRLNRVFYWGKLPIQTKCWTGDAVLWQAFIITTLDLVTSHPRSTEEDAISALLSHLFEYHVDLLGPIKSLGCNCCGNWWNRDTGYGMCVDCIKYVRSQGMPEHEISDLYGYEHIHWGVEP